MGHIAAAARMVGVAALVRTGRRAVVALPQGALVQRVALMIDVRVWQSSEASEATVVGLWLVVLWMAYLVSLAWFAQPVGSVIQCEPHQEIGSRSMKGFRQDCTGMQPSAM